MVGGLSEQKENENEKEKEKEKETDFAKATSGLSAKAPDSPAVGAKQQKHEGAAAGEERQRLACRSCNAANRICAIDNRSKFVS
jgi:hypothetical protein